MQETELQRLVRMMQEDRLGALAYQAMTAGLKLDANETALLDRQLTFVEAQLYETEYPGLMHRQFIPQDTSTPVWAQSISSKVIDRIEKASLISDYADNLPLVDVQLTESMTPVKGVGNGYMYSQRDLQAATAPMAVNLDAERAQTARGSIERTLDDIACFGDSGAGLKGFVNDDLVDVLTAATVDGDTTWEEKIAGSTANGSGPKAVIADMNEVVNAVNEGTQSVWEATDLLLPTDLYNLIATTPFSAEGGSDRSILEWFRQNHNGQNGAPLVRVSKWWRLDAANAAGTGGRIVGYARSPQILVEKAVMPFTMLPPQAKGLAFLIYCWALTGGTVIKRPKGVKYLDGAN
ncbi:MAG: DUF2184 domain-containing protein [Gammaproteobacteria bacterium]|nr:DUF2184 domain-containing protein [Gammaproteobacteria bacterium]NIR85140.1 DUF2184 domain-containing protein [Gammaproteobacteria bacterium]NIU06189.1 DUF2184 domain-containing protein [Gammaproteobacteria bacterium]NIX87462.1 DUF2184 domain-containing protein [Gammaproteobacteria bacterium]